MSMEGKKDGGLCGGGCPKLLDLIHRDKGRDWVMKEGSSGGGGKFGVGEAKKLELRLGPPGNDSSEDEANVNVCGFGSQNKHTWFRKTQQYQQQQQPQGSYLQFPTKEQSQLQQGYGTKAGLVESQNHQIEKKICSGPSAVNNSSQKRNATSPVVGWPPVRSFRKNLAHNSSPSKPVSESQNGIVQKEENKKVGICSKGLFVKINMDGVPIGRKVDIKAYDSYDQFSLAVDELFRGLLAAQKDTSGTGGHNKMEEVAPIKGLLAGSGEYTLLYEDNEGDIMLVGDDPWSMFASTVKRLRVMKTSELPKKREFTSMGCGKREIAHLGSTAARRA